MGYTVPRKKLDDIINHLDTVHEHVRRRDRQTLDDSKDCAYAQSRAVIKVAQFLEQNVLFYSSFITFAVFDVPFRRYVL